MANLLITITYQQRSFDLEVPGDVFISKLLPLLATQVIGASPSAEMSNLCIDNTPLDANLTLEQCGVRDGVQLSFVTAKQPSPADAQITEQQSLERQRLLRMRIIQATDYNDV